MDPAFPFGRTKPRKEHLVVDIGAGLELGPDFRGGDRKRGVVVGNDGVDDGSLGDGGDDILVVVVEEERGDRANGPGCCFQWKWFPDVGDGRVLPRVVVLVEEMEELPSVLAGRPLDRGHHR